MHDDGIDAGLLQEGDIGRESLAELGVTHCVAAVFHHDGLVFVALHVRQRLRQKFRLKFAVGSGHRYPRRSKMDAFFMYVRSARNKRNGAASRRRVTDRVGNRPAQFVEPPVLLDRTSTRLNSSHYCASRMPSTA